MVEPTHTFVCNSCALRRAYTIQELDILVVGGSATKKKVLTASFEGETYFVKCPYCSAGTLSTRNLTPFLKKRQEYVFECKSPLCGNTFKYTKGEVEANCNNSGKGKKSISMVSGSHDYCFTCKCGWETNTVTIPDTDDKILKPKGVPENEKGKLDMDRNYIFKCDMCGRKYSFNFQQFNEGIKTGDVRKSTTFANWVTTCKYCANDYVPLCTRDFIPVPEPEPAKEPTTLTAITEKEQGRLDRAKKIAETLNAKNKAYGDSFAKSGVMLSILFPDISKERATVILAVTRIIDKLFRIANDPTAFGEDPAMDIAGYGMLLQELVSNE